MKATIRTILAITIAVSIFAGAKASDQKAKKDANGGQVWDSGSFGIFQDGKRIGTEKFNIESRGDFSVATSEIKVDDGTYKANQTAEMKVTPKGELQSYSWHATSPQKEESTVEAKEPAAGGARDTRRPEKDGSAPRTAPFHGDSGRLFLFPA